MKVIVEADGGARGNPGPAGYGAVVRDPATGTVLAERFAAIGLATNNVAEYSGLIAGLEAAAEIGASQVEVRMDSKLVVEQMSGRWQIKHPGLRPLAAQAAALVKRFDQVSYGWIPRERNRAADALANQAMDAAKGIETEPLPQVVAAGARTADGWAPRTTEATRLILVRHGETPMTAQKRYSGRIDVELSERGTAQAEATALRLAAGIAAGGTVGTPSVVVSSPLIRCVATATAIAKEAGGLALVVEPDLTECDFGEWDGLTFAEVRERFPAELQTWLSSTAVAPPGGESFQRVGKRVRGALGRLRESYDGQTLVIVSHVSPIKLILRDALAAGDAFLHRLYLEPAGVSIVDMWPDGGVAVRTVNDTSHLPAR
jgi:probable phosphoglycerate mutase